MKKKTKLLSMLVAAFICCFLVFSENVEASEGEEEYITIKVQASDDNENLKYAIDSTEDAAFSDANEFTIPAGSSHTIYVKDAAGNITSQTYTPSTPTAGNGNSDEQQINIDLELGSGSSNRSNEDYSNYEYLTDDPVEPGTGTVNSKITTDGSDNAKKVFYTVSTDTGETFYLVVDQSKSTDNAYLLNTVTLEDLKSLAADGNETAKEQEEAEDNLLDALKNKNETEETEAADDKTSSGKSGKSNAMGSNIIILILILIGGGIYYYLKVYKNKKDEMMDTMDAMDMDEFEVEEDEEGEEIEFEVDDEEKERFLSQLIDEDDDAELLEAEPDAYCEEHKDSVTSTSETEEEKETEENFNFDNFDSEEDEEEEE